MRSGIIALLLAVCILPTQAQDPHRMDFYDNVVLADYIMTVEFRHQSIELTMPIIDLGSDGRLRLDFDDLEGGFKNYTYWIVHCDKDWYPSLLDETEYLSGFNGEELPGFGYSSNRYSEYTHYDLTIPNEDISWTISGNYALVIVDDDLEEPVMIRRFIVAEQSASTAAKIVRPRNTAHIRSHHEMVLEVLYNDLRINRPIQELYVTVLQNGNWETAQHNIQGTFERSNSVHFDYMDLISFPAIKEFRSFDIRTLTSRGLNVNAIERNDIQTNIMLNADLPRLENYYLTDFDANGQFVVENRDYSNGDFSSEYAYVNFAIFSGKKLDEDVYIFGAFNDWQPKKAYRLDYDAEQSIYTGTFPFKQGYYDYMYGTMTADGTLDSSHFEGNWHETENDYHIIVYYRDTGGEYDRVVDVQVSGSTM